MIQQQQQQRGLKSRRCLAAAQRHETADKK